MILHLVLGPLHLYWLYSELKRYPKMKEMFGELKIPMPKHSKLFHYFLLGFNAFFAAFNFFIVLRSFK